MIPHSHPSACCHQPKRRVALNARTPFTELDVCLIPAPCCAQTCRMADSNDDFFSEDDAPAPPVEAAAPLVGSRSIPASPLFRPSNLRCVNTLSGHHSGIRAIAGRSSFVYTGSYDNTIKVWNLDGGSCEETLEGHQAWVRSLFCHRTEPLLFSGSDDGEIKIWRTDNHSPHGDIRANAGGILAITVDYDRNWLLAGCYDSSIHVWQLPACETLHILPGHRSAVKSLSIYNGCLLSGRQVASRRHRGRRRHAHSPPFVSSSSPPDLITSSTHHLITLPPPSSRSPRPPLRGPPLAETRSYDRTVKLWDLVDDCKCVGSLGTRGSVWALTVHEGMLLGAIGDSSIKVWRMDTWEQTTTLSGHRGLVLALAAYGDRLISGSDDRCIRVWRMGTWECERILTGHNGGVVGVCIVQGNLVSASNDSFIKVWNSTGVQRPFTAK